MIFRLRPFPKRLKRSLLSFAVVGTLLALMIASDGTGGPWLPYGVALTAWLIPLAFAWQIKKQGYDPLSAFETSEIGLTAHFHDGHNRFLAWESMNELLNLSGFRHRSWVIHSDEPPLRWFGELENPALFFTLVSEKTGKEWKIQPSVPRA
jgi:hypothetical protein